MSARPAAARLRVDEGHRRPGSLHAAERPLENHPIVEVAADDRGRQPSGAAPLTVKTAVGVGAAAAGGTGLPLKSLELAAEIRVQIRVQQRVSFVEVVECTQP